ncbi:MAG: S41 family peptidase [Candidatus Aminicenantales bacterium]
MNIPRFRRIVPYALAAIAAAAAMFFAGRPALQSSKFTPARDFDILESAVRQIRNNYVDEANPVRTMEGAFQGLMGSLDLMSSYLNSDLMARAASPRLDSYFDIGLAVYKRPGSFPVVVGVAEGSPAAKAGVEIGDAISAVDDRSTLAWSYNEFRLTLKDAEPKPVKIRLVHENTTAEKTVIRALPYPAAAAWAAEKGTAGIARVYHLFPGAAAAFAAAVVPKAAGRKEPLILDLRGCREGEIAEAAALINVFVKNPQAGTFEEKGGVKTPLVCAAEPVLPDIPLVVWVDPATMGPSEIVAGVLRDLKRAKVVGTTTAGLTAEQKIFPLKTGDGLLLTVGEFVLPSGEKIFEKGVTPDASLEPGKQTQKDYLEKSRGVFPGR